MVVDITAEQVLRLHERVERHYNVIRGKPNVGLVESIVLRPNQAVYGHVPFDNIFMKCASLMEGIIRWHPFTDGNKRTGLLTAILYLEINGYNLIVPLDAIAFAVDIADGRLPLHKIAMWLLDHAADNDEEFLTKMKKHVVNPSNAIMKKVAQGRQEEVEKTIKNWIAFDAHKDEYSFEQKREDTFLFLLDVVFRSYRQLFLRIGTEKEFIDMLEKSGIEYDAKEDVYRPKKKK